MFCGFFVWLVGFTFYLQEFGKSYNASQDREFPRQIKMRPLDYFCQFFTSVANNFEKGIDREELNHC